MLSDALLAQWGQMVFTVTALTSVAFALLQCLKRLAVGTEPGTGSLSPDAVLWRNEFRRIMPACAVLVALQLSGVLLAMPNSSLRPLLPIAIMYLLFAVALPFLWTAGQVHAARCKIPVSPAWASSRKLLITSVMAAAGIALSLGLVIFNDVRPGAAVENLSGEAGSDGAIVVIALWLLFNAPWMEEIIFRHYLIPRLATLARPKNRAVFLVISTVICAAVFAVGHAGHMVPAWPKLTQTFIWGLLLGWSRIYFGTFSAIMLHLVFNLSAPLAAPFLNT